MPNLSRWFATALPIEPMPARAMVLPRTAGSLRALPNAILTPHLGYATEEQLRAFYQGTVASLQAFLSA